MSIKVQDVDMAIGDVAIEPVYVAFDTNGHLRASTLDAADLVLLPVTGDPDEVILGVHDGIAGSGSLPDVNPDGSFTAVPSVRFVVSEGEVLTEEQHVEKAAEHFKEAIHHDLMATMLRDPRVGPPDTTPEIYRHCGVQPGDTWVERVERLNAIIDGMREERGTKPLTLDDQLRMLAEAE